MLPRAIKAAIQCFDHRKDHYIVMAEAIGRFWILYQGKDVSNHTFYDKFKAIVSVVEEHSVHHEYGGDEEDDKEDVLDTGELEEHFHEKFLAFCFLKKACKVQYKILLEGLHNNYLMGRCAYPDTVNAAYDLINGYQDKARQC
eukprot:15339053-Ditylum_brightwellii.AAC.1